MRVSPWCARGMRVLCVSHAFASVHCCHVVTCLERADLLALVGDVFCIIVTIPCGILGQVWYLIVSIPDLCLLSYFVVLTINSHDRPNKLESTIFNFVVGYLYCRRIRFPDYLQ